jgi:hypothetical protein
VQAIHDAQQARADVLACRTAYRWTLAGQAEDVVALVQRQVQTLRYRRDHLLRWSGACSALEARVVIGRHVAQAGYFFPAQTPRSTPLSTRKSDILGL